MPCGHTSLSKDEVVCSEVGELNARERDVAEAIEVDDDASRRVGGVGEDICKACQPLPVSQMRSVRPAPARSR